ncbi:MAG: methionyl aminopeptidase [Thermoplasmata archaeon]|jgi:methionyl aminopeptidase|nr:methionyl aminopeptidase [Thermoplasmata archaeon]
MATLSDTVIPKGEVAVAVPVVETDQVFQHWVKAGHAAADALQLGKALCVPGARLVDVAAAVEQRIRDLGCGQAFPCTLSIGAVAAHYTPTHDDKTVFAEGDLVKIDCGAEVEGALSDNALTVEVGAGSDGRHKRLIQASEACLKEAIGIIGPNCDLGTVGAAIEMTAKDFGLRTIQNLTGHSLETFNLHAGLTVPNVGMKVNRRPRIGDVLACEPFVTDGLTARVENSGPGNIYHYQRSRPLRLPSMKKLQSHIERAHPRLPFAERWLADAGAIEPQKLGFNLQQLQKEALLRHYPALSEASGGMVAQTEATLVITEDGCLVTTRAPA